LKKVATNPEEKQVVRLNPNNLEGAYAAMIALLDVLKAAQDEQQQEDARR